MPNDDNELEQTTPSEPVVESTEVTPSVDSDIEPTTVNSNPSTNPFEPQDSMNQTAVSPTISTSPNKKKKKIIISGVVSALVVLLAAGSILAYNVIYQSPQKMIGDALSNASLITALSGKYSADSTDAKSKTEFTYELKRNDTVYNGTYEFKYSQNEQNILTLKGAGAYDDKGNAYVKLSNLKNAIDPSYSAFLPSSYTALLEKYDDKWIKISADDLEAVSKSSAESQICLNELKSKMSDEAFKNDLTKSYRAHQFIVMDEDLGAKDGNVGYVVSVDEKIAEEFGKDFKTSDSYKAIKDSCETLFEESDASDKSSNTGDKEKVTIWISQNDHRLQKIETTGEETKSSVEVDYSGQTGVTVPDSAISVSELLADVQKMSAEAFSGSGTSGSVGGSSSLVQTSSPASLRFF